MFSQAHPPQSLPAFGMGVAVGFGAGITVRLFCPGVVGLVNSILSKLGFEIGDIFLALWHPEKEKPMLQLIDTPRAEPKKPRRKAKATTQARVKVQPVSKVSRKTIPLSPSRAPRLRRLELIEVGSN